MIKRNVGFNTARGRAWPNKCVAYTCPVRSPVEVLMLSGHSHERQVGRFVC